MTVGIFSLLLPVRSFLVMDSLQAGCVGKRWEMTSFFIILLPCHEVLLIKEFILDRSTRPFGRATSVALGSTFSSVSNQLASTRFSTLAESGPVRTKPKIKESLRSPGTEGRCSYDMTEVQSY